MSKETAASWSDVYSSERRKRRRIILVSAFLVAYALLIVASWVVIYSPLFKVKSVEVMGNRNVSSDDIITLATAKIIGDSLWKRVFGMRNILVWPSGFSSENLRFLPQLKSLSIEKSYRQRKIKIIVQERELFGVWCLRETLTNTDDTQTSNTEIIPRQSALSPREPACWWFDSDGTIFKKAIDMEGSIVVVVDDYSQKNIGLGSKILPDEFLQNIFSIFRVVSESDIAIKEIRLDDINSQEIEVDTYNSSSAGVSIQAGPKVYFSLRFSAANTSSIIKSLKDKSLFGGLQYVDFRVENRVYYK